MNGIAFTLGPLEIHWYGILVAAAALIGYLLTRRNIQKYGLDPDKADMLLFKLIAAIIIGARLAYVISKYQYYFANPWEIIRLDHGGLGSHGAIITALICGYYWTKKAGLPYWRLADAAAPGLPVGHIFVRLGNFINGELYGPPTTLPWGVKFPETAGPVHPSQLYEIVTSIIILPFALKWSAKPRYPGYSFLRVLLLHSGVRFLMDFVRQPGGPPNSLVLTQVIALIFTVFILGYLWYLEKVKYRNAG
mgnify:CR=1 FL=1